MTKTILTARYFSALYHGVNNFATEPFSEGIRLPQLIEGQPEQVLVRRTVIDDIIKKITARNLRRNQRTVVHSDWVCIGMPLIEGFLESLREITRLNYWVQNLLPINGGERLIWALEKTEFGMSDLFNRFGEDGVLCCLGIDFDSTVVRDPVFILRDEPDILDLFRRFGAINENVERVSIIGADRFKM